MMDRIPDYAAVDECVRLSKRYARKAAIGLTNAVLRDIIKKGAKGRKPSTGDPVRDLAIEYSHPEWLVKRWLAQLGTQGAAELLEVDNRTAPVFVWPNPGRTNLTRLFSDLEAAGFEPRHHPLVSEAVELGRPAGIFEHPLFADGHLYLQDPGAQLVGRLLDLKPGQRLLDLCAAPGGKACWAAGRHPSISVTAVDSSRNKIHLLTGNAARLGLDNILPVCGDAVDFSVRRKFDAVLVDAPCSGLGVLRRRLDLRWRIREDDIGRLAGIQSRILDNAALLVRPGGALVYSTCTLTPEENQEQVAGFLDSHRDFEIDAADRLLPPGTAQTGMLQTWPHLQGTDGAFAARLIRKV
jgi:16S rRNA (cytosine967-C5)-methyltransferase